MVQLFNTSWNEIARRIPELAEAGLRFHLAPAAHQSLRRTFHRLRSVRSFDLGSKDQSGSVSTLYGTKADLLNMINVAHRFGIRVYLDNVDEPSRLPCARLQRQHADQYLSRHRPGGFPSAADAGRFLSELARHRAIGTNSGRSGTSSASNLIDIAQEPGTTNLNFGFNQGDTHRKSASSASRTIRNITAYMPERHLRRLRQEQRHHHADARAEPHFTPNTCRIFSIAPCAGSSIETKADGFRLDAVKHVRDDFFGAEIRCG